MKKTRNERVLKYKCPVCSQLAFSEQGDYEICRNCYWEDDGSTEEYEGSFGPNFMSVKEYREDFLKKGRK
jgi:hypothetical protein